MYKAESFTLTNDSLKVLCYLDNEEETINSIEKEIDLEDFKKFVEDRNYLLVDMSHIDGQGIHHEGFYTIPFDEFLSDGLGVKHLEEYLNRKK